MSSDLGLRGRAGDADDRASQGSTVATTASLSSRIASLAIDFEDKLRDSNAPEPLLEEGEYDDYEDAGEEEEEEVIEVTEEELLRELDRQEPPFQVCSRLFHSIGSNPIPLKRLTWDHVDLFRRKGFVVVDNFVSREAAARLRADTLQLRRQGRLQEAARIGLSSLGAEDRFTDRTARGDSIMWLHPHRTSSYSAAFAPFIIPFQELVEDLGEVMRLRQRACEYQLAVFPAGGAQYVRHRDALPDDGSEEHQRRVTAVLYANPNWTHADGGKLRLWPPKTDASTSASQHHEQAAHSHADGTANGYSDRIANGHSHSLAGELANGADHASTTSPASSERSRALSHTDTAARSPGRGLLGDGRARTGAPAHSGASTTSSLPHSQRAPDHHLASAPAPASTAPSSDGECTPASYGPAANGLSAVAHATRSATALHVTIADPPVVSNGHHSHPAPLLDGLRRQSLDTCSIGEPGSDSVSVYSLRSETAAPPIAGGWGGASVTSSLMAEGGTLDSAADASSVDEGSVGGRSAREREGEGEGVEERLVGGEAVVEVAPLGGRLVLFLAGAVDHAVLPCFSERVALTAWCQ